MKVKMQKGRKWIYWQVFALGKKDEAYYTKESDMLSSPFYHYTNLSKSEKSIYDKLK